jgi:putative ABC transport system permease protein
VNIFRLLGLQPALGRDFLPEEETYGKDHVVLLGHELWKRRFGADTAIVGRSITLNDELYTVIGVMRSRTCFPEPDTQLWTPVRAELLLTRQLAIRTGRLQWVCQE